jgi:hypothetical protein
MNEEGKCSREKYWPELTTDERIERMREVVRRLQNQVSAIAETVEELQNHRHLLPTGELCTPLPQVNYACGAPQPPYPRYGEGKDDVYF